MDFGLSEEQKMLKDGAERYLRESYDYESRRRLVASPEGFSRAHWNRFAELGWLSLPFAEENGGLGGGAVDVMLLMEAMGRHLVLEPYLSSILLAGRLLESAGNAEQKSARLSPLMTGEAIATFAAAEPESRHDLAATATEAVIHGAGYRLNGHKSFVLHGAAADFLILLARSSGRPGDSYGLSLFLVDAAAKGVEIKGYRTMDGSRAADIALRDVTVGRDALLGHEDGALPFVEETVDRAIAALAAESVGVLSAAFEGTLSYMRERKQFGMPLAAFQVIQHRLADMQIALEQVRSLAAVANIRCDGPDALARARAVSAAKAELVRSGGFIAAQAVQLHGGMGMSDELNIGALFKRQQAIQILFGDRAFHIRRFASLAA